MISNVKPVDESHCEAAVPRQSGWRLSFTFCRISGILGERSFTPGSENTHEHTHTQDSPMDINPQGKARRNSKSNFDPKLNIFGGLVDRT